MGHHEHHHHQHVTREASRKALLGALVLLVIAFVAELVGGLVTGSLALIADAAHLLTDVGAVLLALGAQWFAARPSCSKSSFGLRRVEILAALINGVTLWVIAAHILVEGIARLGQPAQVATGPMIVVAAGGLVIQTIVAVILSRAKGESLNVKGAYVHAMTDAVQSAVVVAVGITMQYTGLWVLDPLASLLIAALLGFSGGKIVWEATHVLLERTPPEIDLNEIAGRIRAADGVARVSDLHAWSITTGYNALSAHVVATTDVSAEGRSALTGQLHKMLVDSFALQHVTLQVEQQCTLRCSDWIRTGTDDFATTP